MGIACGPCKKSFAQKVSALKRIKKLPVKVLEEIYFKSIVPAVSYGIVVWETAIILLWNP